MFEKLSHSLTFSHSGSAGGPLGLRCASLAFTSLILVSALTFTSCYPAKKEVKRNSAGGEMGKRSYTFLGIRQGKLTLFSGASNVVTVPSLAPISRVTSFLVDEEAGRLYLSTPQEFLILDLANPEPRVLEVEAEAGKLYIKDFSVLSATGSVILFAYDPTSETAGMEARIMNLADGSALAVNLPENQRSLSLRQVKGVGASGDGQAVYYANLLDEQSLRSTLIKISLNGDVATVWDSTTVPGVIHTGESEEYAQGDAISAVAEDFFAEHQSILLLVSIQYADQEFPHSEIWRLDRNSGQVTEKLIIDHPEGVPHLDFAFMKMEDDLYFARAVSKGEPENAGGGQVVLDVEAHAGANEEIIETLQVLRFNLKAKAYVEVASLPAHKYSDKPLYGASIIPEIEVVVLFYEVASSVDWVDSSLLAVPVSFGGEDLSMSFQVDAPRVQTISGSVEDQLGRTGSQEGG